MTTRPDTPRELRGNFVLLRADTLRLLLPQAEVGAATHLASAPQATDLPGFFQYDGGDGGQPVLALSAQMLPLLAFPPDRFFVTALDTPLGQLGFGWSEVAVLIDARLQAKPLPAPLIGTGAALREFVEIDGRVVFCCDSASLCGHALSDPA